MESTLEGKRCLSAIALFGELVKKNLDIYATLAEFIKYCIYEKSLYTFSVFRIKEALVKNFGFSIPESVIKNAIKRIPEINSHERNYIVKKKIVFREDFENQKRTIDENHKKILTELNKYISNKLKRDITESEKEEIYNTFFTILIQKKSIANQYSNYINFFIIENEKNEDIIRSLNIIKEGVLVYSAFQYSPDEYSKKTWTEELVLYFDTELLFSIYGLNGKLYQGLLEELLDLIRKINETSMKKEKRNIIELRYFDEIKDEIDRYFNAAVTIIQSDKNIGFQKTTAMLSILNGCNDISEIIEKKALFFNKLKYYGFEQDEKEYYEEESDMEYNIISKEGYNQILLEYPLYEPAKIEDNMRLLNKVAILRKGKHGRRKEAKVFFVTATGLCLNIANHSQVLRIGSVPLTTTVDYLTERFWIKISNNFANINLKNADVVVKSQLVIGSQLDIAISEKTIEIEKRYRENKTDFDSANAVLSEIKQFRNYPETISSDYIDEIIHFTEDSVDKFIDNYHFEKENSERVQKENVALRDENKKMSERLRYFEDKEFRKERIKRRASRISKIILFVLIIVISTAIIILAQLNKVKYPIVSIILSVLGTIGTILGIGNVINYFTRFYEKIKEIFTKNA
jgi:hypothetical protein